MVFLAEITGWTIDTGRLIKRVGEFEIFIINSDYRVSIHLLKNGSLFKTYYPTSLELIKVMIDADALLCRNIKQ